jgi:peptidoglycan hydrolase CwlO-like protein
MKFAGKSIKIYGRPMDGDRRTKHGEKMTKKLILAAAAFAGLSVLASAQTSTTPTGGGATSSVATQMASLKSQDQAIQAQIKPLRDQAQTLRTQMQALREKMKPLMEQRRALMQQMRALRQQNQPANGQRRQRPTGSANGTKTGGTTTTPTTTTP